MVRVKNTFRQLGWLDDHFRKGIASSIKEPKNQPFASVHSPFIIGQQ